MSVTTGDRRHLRFAVIGAGMAGVLSAIKLREAGFGDVVVLEKGDSIGGTWRENTYPGISCDVPSHLYSYSFAPNPDWSHAFAPGAEIQRYLIEVAERFGVADSIRFGTEITSMRFEDGCWTLCTASGEPVVADVVIAATGVLHHPRYPDIAGLDTFAGRCFHSAHWDHDVDLDNARIGVVGTGSTAVQITTALAGRVASYSLFQRTAQWVLAVDNPPIGEQDRARFRVDPQQMADLRAYLSMAFSQNFADAVIDADSPRLRDIQQLCEDNLARVTDPVLREALRPDYRAACKRLVVSPDFYDAIQRPRTRLVTEGIERVEPTGVRTTDGTLHELDVLVLATGFRVDRFLRPIEVTGRDGVCLEDLWARHPVAYLSVSIPEFPNLFLLNGPNGPVGNFSLIDVAEAQFSYIHPLLDLLASGKVREISADPGATARYEAARVEAAANTIWVTGCRSWYLDADGVPAAWPWTMQHFQDCMAAPDLTHFDVR